MYSNNLIFFELKKSPKYIFLNYKSKSVFLFEILKIIRNTFLKATYLATKKCWNYLFRLKIIDISASN